MVYRILVSSISVSTHGMHHTCIPVSMNHTSTFHQHPPAIICNVQDVKLDLTFPPIKITNICTTWRSKTLFVQPCPLGCPLLVILSPRMPVQLQTYSCGMSSKEIGWTIGKTYSSKTHFLQSLKVRGTKTVGQLGHSRIGLTQSVILSTASGLSLQNPETYCKPASHSDFKQMQFRFPVLECPGVVRQSLTWERNCTAMY